ncbi:uncharacterized protein LOC110386194 [Bombyx mori]|uniref:Seminal fluid protein 32 n=1 Tax=Bombyx mori TaxID=7091 RepID=A0A0P0UWE5_BOMMO|nr:uncharacterized protein LOC110386194 [Bombyx mori]BAS69678.1 seminal fluid protein 32 [Bombyx mori]
MNFTFLCLVIVLYFCGTHSHYNKDVVCIKDQGQEPLCKTVERPNRRHGSDINNNIPSYDPYIPRSTAIVYKCSSLECKPIIIRSLTQLTPNQDLKACFTHNEEYVCETIRYGYLKNVDKILFLSSIIRNKMFYNVDCLHYSDGRRVCLMKDGADSYSELVDFGTIARRDAPNVYSEDEFICEEDRNRIINCDLNLNVPYPGGIRLKKFKSVDEIIMKTGPYVVLLKPKCMGAWCGYSGRVSFTRRASKRYEPPGGKTYRCYYAKNQQICKELDENGLLN